jgi:hypothetical protein
MGGECSTYGEGFSLGNLKEKDHVELPGVDGRIFKEIICICVDWIDVLQDRDS